MAQVGDVDIGFSRGLAIGPELKMMMFGLGGRSRQDQVSPDILHNGLIADFFVTLRA